MQDHCSGYNSTAYC